MQQTTLIAGERTQIDKLETLRATVEAQYRAAYKASYPDMPGEITMRDTTCKLTLGSKWARVDVGSSGKYMVAMATGEIVGIKAYGVPHNGHRFGTLDTIDLFDWSGYVARRMTATA